jgi:outer membrane protein assembly factor BamB
MLSALILLVLMSGAGAQDKSSRAQLPVEQGGGRRLDQAREFIAAEQWRDAFDALRPLFGAEGNGLVRAEGGRYLPGRTVAQVLLSRLPAKGLIEHRKRGEGAIREAFERGLKERDEEALAGVVEDDFASTYADDALFWLGEFAFERGDLVAARGHWRKLVPPQAMVVVEGGTAPLMLNHPDPDVDLVEVRARLILCSILLGEYPRAARELEAFGELHGEARGTFAGEEVVWRVRLAEELADAFSGGTSADTAYGPTFAGSAARTGVARSTPDVAAQLWETPWSRQFWLPGAPDDTPADRRPVPCHVPVIDGERVFACDDSAVYGWKLGTGEPIWEAEPERPAHEVFRLSLDEQGHLLDRNDGWVGVPHHTVTVHRGRLYARLGAIDRVHHTTGLPPSHIVCLDVGEQEGKPLWVISVDEIGAADGKWMFEGTPAVTDDGVYVALTRPGTRPACGLAALHPETGRVRWFRMTCEGGLRWTGDEDRGRPDDGRRHVVAELSHSLVTVAGGRVFHTTQQGAVVCLDANNGQWAWGTTYPQTAVPDPLGFAGRRFHGPSPAVYADGILFVVPHDSSHILGLDSESGLVRWSVPHRQRIGTVLGVAEGRVYVSGDELWALDAATGERRWGHGSRDDQLEGFGRGVLCGDEILWPMRDAIRVVDRKSGRFVRAPIDLSERGVKGGGHLLAGPGVLLISTPFHLAALGEKGAIRPEKPLETRAPGSPDSPTVAGPPSRGGASATVVNRWLPERVSSATPSSPEVPSTPRDGAAADKVSPWWRVAWEREFDRDCRWEVVPSAGTNAGSESPRNSAPLVCDMARGVVAFDARTGNELWSRALPGPVREVMRDGDGLRVDTSLLTVRLDPTSGAIATLFSRGDPRDAASRSESPDALFGGRMHRRGAAGKVWFHDERGVLLQLVVPPALEWRRTDGTLVGRMALARDDELAQAVLIDGELAGIVTRQFRCALWRADSRRPEWYAGPMSRAFALPVWIAASASDSAGDESSGSDSAGDESSGSDAGEVVPCLVKDGLTLARVDRGTLRDRWSVDLGPGVIERVHENSRSVSDRIVVLGRHDLRAFDTVTGDERWRMGLDESDARAAPEGSGSSRHGWRWESVSADARTITLRRGVSEGVEFLRVDAASGLPVQRLALPYLDGAIGFHEWADHACVTGPRMALGWAVRQ